MQLQPDFVKQQVIGMRHYPHIVSAQVVATPPTAWELDGLRAVRPDEFGGTRFEASGRGTWMLAWWQAARSHNSIPYRSYHGPEILHAW